MANITRSDVMHQELEFLLAVLVAIDRRVIHTEERALDLFGGYDRSRHYGAWLHGHALVEPSPACDLDTKLAAEGCATLLMLASTRSPKAAPLPIGLPSLRPYHGLNFGMEEEARETILAAQERAAERLQYRFQREEIGKAPGIVLLGEALGPNVPLRRKLWSMTTHDPYARDRLYFWLHERIDRWPNWGELLSDSPELVALWTLRQSHDLARGDWRNASAPRLKRHSCLSMCTRFGPTIAHLTQTLTRSETKTCSQGSRARGRSRTRRAY